MASAKQIAWRKKFAKMAKSGKFKKAKRTSRTVKTGKMKGWDVEITGTSYAKKSKPEKKNSSRAKLEQRIADLEEKFHQKLHTSYYYTTKIMRRCNKNYHTMYEQQNIQLIVSKKVVEKIIL